MRSAKLLSCLHKNVFILWFGDPRNPAPHMSATVKHGRPQAWARGEGKGALASPWKCCKVFCALVVTVKRSVDQLFMHYFRNFSSTSGGFAPRPSPGLHPGPRWRTFVSRPLICPSWKKSRGRPCSEEYLVDTHTGHVNHLLLGVFLQDRSLCFDAQNERILAEAEPVMYV